MKKFYLIPVVVFVLVLTGCKKNDSDDSSIITPVTPPASVNAFDVFFDGKEYKGGVKYNGFPVTPGGAGVKYKSLVTGYENQDVNFSLTIPNVPDSGVVKTLCSSACDPNNGDTNISFNAVEVNLSEFTGTVERVSSGKIIINAAKNGKTLTGFVQWK